MSFWKDNNHKRLVRMIKEMLAIVRSSEKSVDVLHKLCDPFEIEKYKGWSAKMEKVAHIAHDVAREIELEERIGEEVAHDFKEMDDDIQKIKQHSLGKEVSSTEALKKIESDVISLKRVLDEGYHNLNARERVELRIQRIMKQLQHMYSLISEVLTSVRDFQARLDKKDRVSELDEVMNAMSLLVHLFKDIFNEMTVEVDIESHLKKDIDAMQNTVSELFKLVSNYENSVRAQHNNVTFYPKVMHEIQKITLELQQIEQDATRRLSN